jgi:hypothetical protein
VFDVAQKYGIRRKAILSKNRMARNEDLRPGACCGCSTCAPAKWLWSTGPCPKDLAQPQCAGSGCSGARTRTSASRCARAGIATGSGPRCSSTRSCFVRSGAGSVPIAATSRRSCFRAIS